MNFTARNFWKTKLLDFYQRYPTYISPHFVFFFLFLLTLFFQSRLLEDASIMCNSWSPRTNVSCTNWRELIYFSFFKLSQYFMRFKLQAINFDWIILPVKSVIFNKHFSTLHVKKKIWKMCNMRRNDNYLTTSIHMSCFRMTGYVFSWYFISKLSLFHISFLPSTSNCSNCYASSGSAFPLNYNYILAIFSISSSPLLSQYMKTSNKFHPRTHLNRKWQFPVVGRWWNRKVSLRISYIIFDSMSQNLWKFSTMIYERRNCVYSHTPVTVFVGFWVARTLENEK